MSTTASQLNAQRIVEEWASSWGPVIMVPIGVRVDLRERIDKAIRIALDQGAIRRKIEATPWPDPRQVEPAEAMASAAARIIEMQAVMLSIARMASHYSKED